MSVPSRPLAVSSAAEAVSLSLSAPPPAVSSASAYVSSSLSLPSSVTAAPSRAPSPAPSPAPAAPAAASSASSVPSDEMMDAADSAAALSDERFRWEGAWERSWEKVDPSADLSSSRLSAQRVRKSLLSSSLSSSSTSHTVVEKGMLRNLYICVDVSPSMDVNDLRPSRKVITLKLVREFLREFFDENPLASVGFFLCYQRAAEKISDLKGSPTEQLAALEEKIRNLDKKRKIVKESQARGPAALMAQPGVDEDISLEALLKSVQQAFESVPPFATKEVLLIVSSLSTVDDGDIYRTLKACADANICVNIISLSAEMFVCRELAQRTNGAYHIVLNEDHYRRILFSFLPPSPIPLHRLGKLQRKWIRMGFPSYVVASPHTNPSYCSCHGEYRPNGYVCPRCSVKVCELPTVCSVCGMMLIKAAHLAKTYHHLFPPPEYRLIEPRKEDGEGVEEGGVEEKKETARADGVSAAAVSGGREDGERMCWEGPLHKTWEIATDSSSVASSSAPVESWHGVCFACRKPLSSLTDLRIQCERCSEQFCMDCDEFVHEMLYNCVGCQMKAAAEAKTARASTTASNDRS